MDNLPTSVNFVLVTIRDVLPVAVILLFFQLAILRQPIPHLGRFIVGFGCVLAGLALFLFGLKQALFPIGRHMAAELASPRMLFGDGGPGNTGSALAYTWIYLYAAAIGFSTTIAEPALMAVAQKAGEVSRGSVHPWGLRIAVAIGVAIGIVLGTYRIISGIPLVYIVGAGYVVVVVQTIFAPKDIIPLAYDSGGVTTSTVTVPIVAALGLGLSSTIPGRNPVMDGFGMIALASLFPMITVMGYAQAGLWWTGRKNDRPRKKATNEIPVDRRRR